MSSVHYKSTAKWNLFVKYMERLEYMENQILPVILLGEQGGDPPYFIRFGLKRPLGSGQCNTLPYNNISEESV